MMSLTGFPSQEQRAFKLPSYFTSSATWRIVEIRFHGRKNVEIFERETLILFIC